MKPKPIAPDHNFINLYKSVTVDQRQSKMIDIVNRLMPELSCDDVHRVASELGVEIESPDHYSDEVLLGILEGLV